MSALALICKNRGHEVEGSDIACSDKTELLAREGIAVRCGHDRTDFGGIDLVVYNAAIAKDNPERVAAKEQGVPCIKRSQLLGHIMAEYRQSIAVSGSHGKTTVTAMLASVFNGRDPTVHIGGDLEILHGSYKIGTGSEYFITEACEYKRSFLTLKPTVGVVLNIDEDHLDYFADIDDIFDAFVEFGGNVAPNGTLVVNGEDILCLRAAVQSGAKNIVAYGLSDKFDYSAGDIKEADGYYSFEVRERNRGVGRLSLKIPGKHNVLNALAAYSAAVACGLKAEEILGALKDFGGAARRFMYMGMLNGAKIIADYAHHPSEIEALMNTVRLQKPARIVAVFQPHTYTRTQRFFDKFVHVLGMSDEAIILPVYAAREKEIKGVTGNALADAMNAHGYKARSLGGFKACATYLKNTADKDELILLIGAGDIIRLAELLV